MFLQKQITHIAQKCNDSVVEIVVSLIVSNPSAAMASMLVDKSSFKDFSNLALNL